ncbi:maltokinase N-terminal cap-like domain-containing protein [Streptomyces somaliensis]|uniref:1,4-alpha-glucan branching protein n=1 Tax=Streptomyces somaliensis (strain ATCC 33201 / DSM 40738 / JCM 12659 / KCTC 9044 / NCTC 11332 / NRRL B-12077 / IP 733) TaxID=1134445 RepID=A0AA44DGK3_STRE0|nr:1,4-alpha-glucan branching protein [Streptomyces somaliensis]NKY16139.1 1,4-alpha-glucan branching protein [Streptomyces somaliensis DSM 40738]
MASIHRTTLTPGKLELLTGWLPGQSWYAGGAGAPELVRSGGFRLDDPEGAVGIEFMIVTDTAAREPVTYLVPMGYRDAPLEGVPGQALIGTSEHGVLGTRWVYDGAHDPVVTARLRALLRGEAEPQHQSESDTPDPTVVVLGTGPADGSGVRLNRVLSPSDEGLGPSGRLVAGWTRPDGTAVRGVLAAVVPR